MKKDMNKVERDSMRADTLLRAGFILVMLVIIVGHFVKLFHNSNCKKYELIGSIDIDENDDEYTLEQICNTVINKFEEHESNLDRRLITQFDSFAEEEVYRTGVGNCRELTCVVEGLAKELGIDGIQKIYLNSAGEVVVNQLRTNHCALLYNGHVYDVMRRSASDGCIVIIDDINSWVELWSCGAL